MYSDSEYAIRFERSMDEINLSICGTSSKVILKRTGYTNLKRDRLINSEFVVLLSRKIDQTTSCGDRKSTRLNSSHSGESRMPSSA